MTADNNAVVKWNSIGCAVIVVGIAVCITAYAIASLVVRP